MRNGLRAGGFDGVGDDQDAAGLSIPADSDDGLSLSFGVSLGPHQVGIEVLCPVGQQGLSADDDGVPVNDALHALALHVREFLDRGKCSGLVSCRDSDRLGNGVFGGVFDGTGQP